MGNNNSVPPNTNRRSLLKSIGAGSTALGAMPSIASLTEAQVLGTGSATPSNADTTSQRSLVIESSDRIAYEFTVTGLLSADGAPSETVERGTGSGTLTNGSHEFSFTGEFTAFEIEGDATVTVDAEEFEYESFPHNRLEIIANGTVDYDVSATGGVEIESGSADTPSNRRVTGTVVDGVDSQSQTISYAGELTYLDVDGDATVIDNGTEIDPDRPVPSVEPGRAQIESLGREHDYYLHLGWDVATEYRGDAVDSIEYGLAQGTASFQSTAYSFSGTFQFVKVPGVGVVKNDPENSTVECASLSDRQVSVTIVTSVGSEERVSVNPGESATTAVRGQITHLRMVSGDRRGADGIELDIEQNVTATAAERAKKLQLAAKLERETEFETLAARARMNGRIRQDPAGITAFRITHARDTEDLSQRDLYIGAKYALTDVDGHDIVSTRLSKNTSTGEVEEAQIIERLRTEENIPSGVRVRALDTANHENENAVGVLSVENTQSAAFRTATVQYDQDHTPQNNPGQGVTTQGIGDSISDIIDGGSDLITDGADAVSDIADDGADIVVEVTQAGTSVTLTGIGTLSDWNYIEGNFHGFSKSGARALNSALKSTSPFVSILNTYGEDGEVTICNSCIAVGLAAIDVGLGEASTVLCAAITGVGALGCMLFLSTLADLMVQYKADEALQRACVEAGVC